MKRAPAGSMLSYYGLAMRWTCFAAIAVTGCGGAVEDGLSSLDSASPRVDDAGIQSDAAASASSVVQPAPPKAPTPTTGNTGSAIVDAAPAIADAGPAVADAIVDPDSSFITPVFFEGGGGFVCPETYPLPTLAEWLPRIVDSSLTVGQALAAASAAVVGTWQGVVTTAWMPEYPVHIEFRADGGYSSSCDVANACCTALYWGTDADSELKRYVIDSVQRGGTLAGEIAMVWCYPDTGCYVGWSGTLANIDYDASGNRIHFDLINANACCPVHVELERL